MPRHYKIGPSTDHRAKFRASQPMHFDLALKKSTNLGQSPTRVRPAP